MRRVALLITAAALSACAVTPSQEQLASADYGAYPPNYQDIIKAYLDESLKDPESARVQYLNAPQAAYSTWGGLQFGFAVCASVNAKNSFGGYTGAQTSYFLIRNGRIALARFGAGEYTAASVRGMCAPFLGKFAAPPIPRTKVNLIPPGQMF